MNHTVFAVFCLMVCCKCMAMSADLAQIEQGISYKIEAMIRFDLDSKTQFNYREVRHDGNVYVRIANHPQKRISNRVQTTQEQRVYVHRSDGFTYVAAYDSSYPYLSTQRKVMQFRPLSFAVQLAFDLVNPV